jgi:GNAT superfamily N-acetyltransferase
MLRVWEHEGALAVYASDPALAFLSTVSWCDPRAVPAVMATAEADFPPEVSPTLLGPPKGTDAEGSALRAAGYVRVADRGLALRGLGAGVEPVEAEVREAGTTGVDAVAVLLAGYEAPDPVASFIGAEHRLPAVRLFLAVDHDEPIAAAAMSMHGDVVVLGGAATVRAHRGKGAQLQLLRYRLLAAAQAGCTLAVATAVPESASAANLERAGFGFHRRPAWSRRRAHEPQPERAVG